MKHQTAFRQSARAATIRRWMRRHQRWLGAGLVGLAVFSCLRAVQPPTPPTVAVVVAARDLAAGQIIAEADVQLVAWPEQLAAEPVFRDVTAATGRLTAGPIRRGEPLSGTRVLGPGLLADVPNSPGRPELVATSVRLADPSEAHLVRAGEFVDILAAKADELGASTPNRQPAQVVASAARVILVPDANDSGSTTGLFGGTGSASGTSGSLLVVAVDSATAATLAAAAAGSRLSLAVRPGPPEADSGS